ncbi:BA75_00593T0 [Komagataella pastoris]|uniref:BA75_00593T0 n=1 Tax=Komagataella pastoris TaxID=4922 RepID=A0A1B2J8Q1_PICPA|nr:BA75_00593T0 [Komagataella pastoris]
MRLFDLLRQRVPVRILPLPTQTECTEEFFHQLISTCESIVHLNPSYVRKALSRIIDSLEARSIYDDLYFDKLYELYASLSSQPLGDLSTIPQDILEYRINEKKSIRIKESPNFISGRGTTGLRTWEASKLLALRLNNDYSYLPYIQNKKVVELGAGTGLIGISLLGLASHVTLTDGDPNLVDQITNNISLNESDTLFEPETYSSRVLLWGGPELAPKCDTLIGADVTYDLLILPELVKSLQLYEYNVALIGATVRNEATINAWEAQLTDANLNWEIIEIKQISSNPEVFDEPIWFDPSGGLSIKVYKICK